MSLSVAVRFPLILIVLQFIASSTRAEDWPQWRGPRRDGTWNEMGLVEKFKAKELTARWRKPIGPGYSGPTVAGGKVYITDRQAEPEQVERVHCFDERSGEPVWSFSYPCVYRRIGYVAGPRAAVTIDEGRAFALGAMGNIYCFDAAKGDVIWKRDLNEEYKILASQRMPIWGIAGSPFIYKGLVILHIGGADGACIVALDKKTGKEVWRALNDRAQYTTPTLVEQGGKPVVVCWTGDSVAGLDPDSGKVYWRTEMTPKNMPIGIATPIVSGEKLFVTSFYDGALMLSLNQGKPAVDEAWRIRGESERKTDALHSIISTPLFLGDYLYGVDSYGELRCLKAATGERVWENLTATPKARWSNIHFVRNRDRTWMFNERGELLIGKLNPKGFEEISRAKLIEPTLDQLNDRGGVCWSHPAFANRAIFARNDKELACASLAAGEN